MTQFAGEFETHLTVAAPGAADVERLRAWARQNGCKFTHIVLARGANPSQPMLTRHGCGVLATALDAAAGLCAELQREGFAVTRVKVEASPFNADVPQTDADAERHPPERHFEHHLKLLLPTDADLEPLTAVAERHAAHVSRNALRVREDGRQERFVTQRCHGVGRVEARRRFEALRGELAAGGYEVTDAEEEFVVHDSNAGLDAGWISPSQVTADAGTDMLEGGVP